MNEAGLVQVRAASLDRWASLSHEESSYLAARIGAAAYETKRNAILDSTGNSSNAKLNGKIDAAHAAGFKVEGNYITVHPDTAVARANERAAKTGRAVPAEVRDMRNRLTKQVADMRAKGHTPDVGMEWPDQMGSTTS